LPDETPRNGPSIREYFERMFEDHAKAHAEHQQAHDREHSASEKAIAVASQLAKENKADANEWRSTMSDRERTFARSDAVDRMDAESDRRLAVLERSNAQMQGALNVARFIGFSGLVSGGAAIIWVITRGSQ
jgi:hypothetical protein